jgi:hypothetical protein
LRRLQNVIPDWDDIAVKTIQPPSPAPPIGVDLTFRASARVEVAMFNAVDCIEPKYHPYGMQVEPSPDTSQDAAAATAAATVLMKLVPNNDAKQQLADLAKIPDGPAKDRGIKVGQDAAAKTTKMGEKDGATTRNAYRPITEPGRYTMTGSTLGYWAMDAKPFVLKNAEQQFRPESPPDLKSDTWALDHNEIKEIGENRINQAAANPPSTEKMPPVQ